ncbi:MAG: sigma-70 family RNA polymerase sigma factor [Acidobacteriota bacterium]
MGSAVLDEHTPDLLARHEAGDVAAYETLIERYQPALERFVRSHSDATFRDRVPVDDLVQEVHVVALERLPSFEYRRDLSFFFWLCGIARNRIRMHARRLSRRPPPISLNQPRKAGASTADELIEVLAAPGNSPSAELRAREDLHAVALALTQLPERRRDAIVLRHVEGRDPEEAAELLGISPGAFRVLTSRALVQLRAELDRLLGDSC